MSRTYRRKSGNQPEFYYSASAHVANSTEGYFEQINEYLFSLQKFRREGGWLTKETSKYGKEYCRLSGLRSHTRQEIAIALKAGYLEDLSLTRERKNRKSGRWMEL